MKLKNYLVGALVGVLIGGISMFSGCKKESVPIDVDVGEMVHTSNRVTSKNYVCCTSFVLDFGDEAIYSHVVPIPKSEIFLHPEIYNKGNHLENVLDNSLEILESEEVGLGRVSAYIHSGSEKDLKYLMKQLSEKGISVKRGTYEPANKSNREKRRSVTFDPVSNEMTVEYTISYGRN